MKTPYDTDLDRNPANYQPLTPLGFLERAAAVFPGHTAIIHGPLRRSYAEFYARTRRLASALAKRGIKRGDSVSAMLANTPAMLECHYGVPMTQGVLNTLNTRLDAPIIAFSLDHAEAKVVIIDREFSKVMKEALALCKAKPLVIDYDDPEYSGAGERLGEIEYEDFVAQRRSRLRLGDAGRRMGRHHAQLHQRHHRRSERRGLSPSRRASAGHGQCHHLRHAAASGLSVDAADVPLQRLVLSLDRVDRRRHACLPARGARGRDVRCDCHHKVTHLCGAPIVMAVLLNATQAEKKPLPHVVNFATAAAPPPEAVLAAMKAAGFNVTHVYGLTEVYGPAVVNEWHDAWDALPLAEQAAKKSRQGVRYPVLEALDVRHPDTLVPVARDGETLGEVMMRGNVVMKGYLKNKASTAKAFEGGWFHTGDLGVMYPDGYIQLKDRSKDIIISGGENISSIEVEDALYKHPAVLAVAVVAKPDDKWGETPCAFVELKPGAAASADELLQWCKKHLAGYKVPRYVVFAEIPKTSTGKIQKFKLREMAKAV